MTDTNHNPFRNRLALTTAQGSMVDHLLGDGRAWGDASEVEDAKERQVAALLQLIDEYPEESAVADDLVSLTMARIGAMADADRESICPAGLRFQSEGGNELAGSGRSLRTMHWREIASIAAVILLLVSVSVPMLENARAQSVREKCCANMLGTAMGFSGYGGDHRGNLPALADSAGDDNWLLSRANSANLFALAKSGYVSLETLSCPGNSNAEVNEKYLAGTNWPDRSGASFSYQNQLGSIRMKWQRAGSAVAVLSDRNPIVDSAAAHLAGGGDAGMPANVLSPGHGGELQNVLLSDGRVMQLEQPVFAGDNIWLPRDLAVDANTGLVRLTGREMPVDESDSMLIQ